MKADNINDVICKLYLIRIDMSGDNRWEILVSDTCGHT